MGYDETQVGLYWKYPISELIKLRITRWLNFCQQRAVNRNQIGLTCQIKWKIDEWRRISWITYLSNLIRMSRLSNFCAVCAVQYGSENGIVALLSVESPQLLQHNKRWYVPSFKVCAVRPPKIFFTRQVTGYPGCQRVFFFVAKLRLWAARPRSWSWREREKTPLDAAVTSLTSMRICFELGRWLVFVRSARSFRVITIKHWISLVKGTQSALGPRWPGH